MKKITNHFRAIVVIAMMLSVAFPTLAHDFEVNGIYYNYLDKTAKTVEVTCKGSNYSDYSNEYDGAVTIPSSVIWGGIRYSVTKIESSAFYGCTGLTSITIPNSVTSIGESAFYRCTGLTSITIPNSVTSIGSSAFSYCTGLTSVTIPNSVTEIGESAFSSCRSLPSVTIPNSVTSIGSSAFSWCSGLTSVTIPNSVTSIGDDAFYKCSGLPSVTIPNSVTKIGDYAFYGCTGLTSVTIPNSVAEIGDGAFGFCTGLTTVNYNAKNCILMGSSSSTAFIGCSKNIKTLNIGNEVKTIPSYAFKNCSGLTSVTIPNSVTSIGESAFYGCTGLTSITIPNSVTSIGSSAFSYCTGLTSVTIPNSVTEIGESAFSSCRSLPSVTIPNSVTSIGSSAFSWCSGLTSVTIPNSVTSIGESAFSYCTGLTSVTIPNSVTEIGESSFADCSGLTDVNYNAENCSTMGSSSSPVFNGCSNLKTLNIGNDVKTIPSYALSGCTGLTSVTIPNSVTKIGESAFADCTGLTTVNYNAKNCISMGSSSSPVFSGCSNFKTLNIGNDVKTIPSYAFSWCTGLTSIIIPNSVTTIGASAFFNTSWYYNLADGVIYINNVLYEYKGEMPEGTHISIKEGTVSISPEAFYRCTGLTSITIPNSVTSIGKSAFGGCTNLENIVSLNENPPTCENNSFDSENYTNSMLYIPKDSYAKYFINDEWGKFSNIVKLENIVSNISINSSSISLELGKTTTLSAIVLPSSATFPNLYWESNNNVATVDQTGKVTAHSKGEAIITAKSKDGSNVTASCIVKVFTYDVESITLSQHDATLAIKDKVTLKYTITPSYVTDNSVTWSNSNPSVASMSKNSDGSVTISCQEEGETIIKVTTNDGTNLSDSCKITVYRIPPTITISTTSENLLIHNTVNLKYTITNSTINTATWSTSDTNVASITSNTDGSVTVFAEAEGVATITATMIDVNGKEFSATCEITVIPPTIVLSQTVANLPVNELLTLNYDITNSSIKNATWTTSNPDVAPIKINGDGSVIVVGLSEGEAIITATMTEVNGVEYSASCKVIVGIGGVEGVEVDNNAIEVARYDIHGCRLSKPSRGVNIVIYSDGSIRKEIEK